MAKLKGLVGHWVRFPNLAQQLMNDPETFLASRDVKTSDYACPEEVHAKLEQMRRFAEADIAVCAEGTKDKLPLIELIKNQRRVVAEHFGEDFIAESIPFGILFKEAPKVDPRDSEALAITGTGTCTFCTDSDGPDVD